MDAHAFTYGSRILFHPGWVRAFHPGGYEPESTAGRRLLAHELPT
ncbi:DUF4157 domain-containing protein [Micromonospora sp. ATCC 39149]|uniref:DUF4157 domain-containing protein n=1 Tax=Micromonospora carbonacea TaxID=47853 RepID=A0A7D6CC07_9ACTN|nr:DUF4157 domain-containing protein [Micromonospora carbonacea]